MSDTETDLIRIEDLRFGWPREDIFLQIDRFRMQRNEKVFLEGPSGSGKSTLLGLIAGVLSPRSGTLTVAGHDMSRISAGRKDALRSNRMGVIFQLFNLLPYLSLIDNVLLPCRFSSLRKKRVLASGASLEDEARRLLASLGLEGRELLKKKVANLSVGQQQRVAAARALIGSPDLIIADEPTSALDTDSRDAFLRLLMDEADRANAGLLFVSHDRQLGTLFERRVSLADLNVCAKETV